MQLLTLLALLCVGVAAANATTDSTPHPTPKPKTTTRTLKQSQDLFIKPFMYGTALILVFTIIGIAYFILGTGDDRDPLIYSKFLSAKKKM